MIMYCLNPQHTHGTVDVPDPEALVMIEEMMADGIAVETETFEGRHGENVTVFWTRDASGGIGTLWEHTFKVLTFNTPPAGLGTHSAVLAESYRVAVGADADAYAQYDRDAEYAVGE